MMKQPGTYVYHTAVGEASIHLQDLNLQVSYRGLEAFVLARHKDILAKNNPSVHMGVQITHCLRENKVELTIYENGGMKGEGSSYRTTTTDKEGVTTHSEGQYVRDYFPQTIITGVAKFSEDHLLVKNMLTGSYSHAELAKKIRTLRHLFATRDEWEKVYLALRNTKLKIEGIQESTGNDVTGERKKLLQARVVDESSNAPLEWNFRYSIFEGEDPVDVLVQENRELNNTEVIVKLAAFDFVQIERDMARSMMERTIGSLQALLPMDVIPYVHLN